METYITRRSPVLRAPSSWQRYRQQQSPTKRACGRKSVFNRLNVYIEEQATHGQLCAVHALNHVVGRGLFTSQGTNGVILSRPDGSTMVNMWAVAVKEDPSRTLQDMGNFSTDTAKTCLQLVGCWSVPLYPTDFERSFTVMLHMCLTRPSFLGCAMCNNVHWITLRSLGHTDQPSGEMLFMDSNEARTELWPVAEVKQKLVDSFCSRGPSRDCIVIFVGLTDTVRRDWHIRAPHE